MGRGRGKSGSIFSVHYDDDDHHGSSNSKSLSSRSKVFAKRTMTLKKKIFELTTLCGVNGCLIVKGPNGELKTWPENRDEVETVVQRYKNINEEDRNKYNRNLSSFLIGEKKKLEIEIDKIGNENDSKTKSLYPTWNVKFDELSEDSLREMQCSLESKLENVKSRVKMKKMVMMNRGDDHPATTTINPCFDQDSSILSLLMFNSEQPQHLDTYNIPSSVPQTCGFFDFNSSHQHCQQQQNHNLLPIRGTLSSMYNPDFGMTENYSTNFVSVPAPLPPTAIFSHDQTQPLQACVPAAPSFQTRDHDQFFNSIYSLHQQQQQDPDFMPINGGDLDTY